MELIKKVDAIKYEKGKQTKTTERLVSDETVHLIINDSHARSFSTISDSLEDFAIGYLIGERIISSISEIKEVKIEGTEIKITIDNYKENEDLMLCSDSSGGWRSKITSVGEVKSKLKITADELIKNIEKLKEEAFIWQKTGGTHVAAIVNNEKNEFIVREDVSRHVAVDKVIGAGARRNFDFSNSYVIYSGRMPGDMVIKIARAGIPILASNAAPSFSGYTTAEKGKITLVGFIRGDRFNVYTEPDRIVF